MTRNSDDRAVGRDVAHDDSASANLDIVAKRDVAKDRRAHAHYDVVAKRRVALAALLAGSSEGHALVELAIIANDGRLPHDDAHAVVDNEAAADGRSRVDFHAEAVATPGGKRAREEFVPVSPQPVLAPIRPDGTHAGRIEQDGYG